MRDAAKLPSCCRHSSAETGNLVNYHLTGGEQEISDLTNYAPHVLPSTGEVVIDQVPSLSRAVTTAN